METTVNPNIGTVDKLTTKMLGIADSKEQDLAGYILSQRDIINATTKILVSVGINADDIRDIKVGTDKDSHKLRIICEVKHKAAYGRKEAEKTDWFTLQSYGSDDDDNKCAFNKNFYRALYNKVYHGKQKHLNIRTIRRPSKENNKDIKKFVEFEFDPDILIAFVYDIVFTDPLYKISAPPIRWKNESDFDNMTGRQRKAVLRKRKEMSANNLQDCVIYVTFSKNAKWIETKIDQETGAKTKVTHTGFCPQEVDAWYRDYDE